MESGLQSRMGAVCLNSSQGVYWGGRHLLLHSESVNKTNSGLYLKVGLSLA